MNDSRESSEVGEQGMVSYLSGSICVGDPSQSWSGGWSHSHSHSHSHSLLQLHSHSHSHSHLHSLPTYTPSHTHTRTPTYTRSHVRAGQASNTRLQSTADRHFINQSVDSFSQHLALSLSPLFLIPSFLIPSFLPLFSPPP